MINKIKPKSNRRSKEELFNSTPGGMYALTPDLVMQDRYSIYWRDGNSFLKNAEGSHIHHKDFPWDTSVILTYSEILNIHKNSRYVLTKDLPKGFLEDSLCTLDTLVIQGDLE